MRFFRYTRYVQNGNFFSTINILSLLDHTFNIVKGFFHTKKKGKKRGGAFKENLPPTLLSHILLND